jgi:hypothetical protein
MYFIIYKRRVKLNIVAHACNPSYLGRDDEEDQLPSQPVSWFTLVLLATEEA